jgi:chemotaxis protein methyltransferase CheR
MVYSRLARRLRARGDRTFAEYLDRAQREPEEWETFVNSLTTNLTSFFREAHHFDILAERLKKHHSKAPVQDLVQCRLHRRGALQPGHHGL